MILTHDDKTKQNGARQTSEIPAGRVNDHLPPPGHGASADRPWAIWDEETAPPLVAGGTPVDGTAAFEYQPAELASLPPQYSVDVEQFCVWRAQLGKNILDHEPAARDVQHYLAWLAAPVHELGRGLPVLLARADRLGDGKGRLNPARPVWRTPYSDEGMFAFQPAGPEE